MTLRRRAACLLAVCLILWLGTATAQRMSSEKASVEAEFPDSWLMVSPQLCKVLAPLLESRGLDAQALGQEMEEQGIVMRALSEDGTQRMSLVCMNAEWAVGIFDFSDQDEQEKKRVRLLADKNDLWERTGLRTQESKWEEHNGIPWLYLYYTVTQSGETLSRGVRYLTVHNGQVISLDWQKDQGRFSNRELSAFKNRISQVRFTRELPEPVHDVQLEVELPRESSTGVYEITGTATPRAQLVLTGELASYTPQELGRATASDRGKFSIKGVLPEQGTWDLTLTCEAEDRNPVTVTGQIAYVSGSLPLSGIDEVITVTEDKTVLRGSTLPAVSLQLLTPYGLAKKRTGADGEFSFELTTKDEGAYSYTLLLDKKGYGQRRYPFTVIRVVTRDQEKDAIRKSAERLSYRELQKGRENNNGKILNLYGPVVERSESGSVTYLRVNYSKDGKGGWTNPVVMITEEEISAREGDMISAVVSVDGVYEEQDRTGKSVSIPRLQILFVDRIE